MEPRRSGELSRPHSSTHVLIGAPRYDSRGIQDTGNAYLYTISGGSWTGADGLISTVAPPPNDMPVSAGNR